MKSAAEPAGPKRHLERRHRQQQQHLVGGEPDWPRLRQRGRESSVVGVSISSSTGVTIGGTAAHGNVIAGNSGDGVDIASGADNLVAGNWIGTNATGTTTLANAGDGVFIDDSSGNTVGGTCPRRGKPDFGQHQRHRDQRLHVAVSSRGT